MFPAFNFLQGGSGTSYTGFYGDINYRLLGFGGKDSYGNPTQQNRDVSDVPSLSVGFDGDLFQQIREQANFQIGVSGEVAEQNKDSASYFIGLTGEVLSDNIDISMYSIGFTGEVVKTTLDRASYEFNFYGKLFPQLIDRASFEINWQGDLFDTKNDSSNLSISFNGAFFSIVPSDDYNIEAAISAFTLTAGPTRVKYSNEEYFNINCEISSMTMEAVSED